jgi:hypothetical protein
MECVKGLIPPRVSRRAVAAAMLDEFAEARYRGRVLVVSYKTLLRYLTSAGKRRHSSPFRRSASRYVPGITEPKSIVARSVVTKSRISALPVAEAFDCKFESRTWT